MNTSSKLGKQGEKNAHAWLKRHGLQVDLVKQYNAPYDLIVNGYRVEVKTASPNNKGDWTFNIHRHGKLNESMVDFYILVLADMPFAKKKTTYIVLPSPIKVKSVYVSFNSILGKYCNNINNLDLLKNKA